MLSEQRKHALEDAGAVDALAASPYFGGALGKR